jgi:hypothetical protein
VCGGLAEEAIMDEYGFVYHKDCIITDAIREELWRQQEEFERNAESKKLPPVEKAIDTGIASGATMEGLDLALAAEEPSVYWWIKGALMEKMKDDREVTIDDVENIIVMVAANAPLNSIDNGMKEAEQFGDKNIWEILKLAAIGRSEILTEDQIHSEKLRDFQAEEYEVANEENEYAEMSCEDCYEEIKKGDLIHDDGYGILICKKCYSNYKIPCEHEACDERFKDKDEEREHRQETCNRCGGEGWVMTHYTPATYHDPADVDGEDCDECGGEGWVCDKFNAESFSAESNGDKQLDLAVKRTKMSALRTGLAITTFAIVMWNVWTNKKQEKDIADIMAEI